jgi:23S rRNA-/tRNA-specific pseudouridylate synthase
MSEFKTTFRDQDEVRRKCQSGEILIYRKGLPVTTTINTVLLNGDKLSIEWTAIEPEVKIPHLSKKFEFLLPHIVYNHDGIIGVYKPPGLPTIPQGQYYITNLTSITRKFLCTSFLQPINRLDKCVAGLVLFHSTPDEIKSKSVRVVSKRYLALVEGEWVLPNEYICTVKLRLEKHIPNQVLKTLVDEHSGVDCETKFSLMSRSNQMSIILCQPVTGRTHQIRAHLGYMGYPIVGDTLYGLADSASLEKQPDLICLFSFEYRYIPVFDLDREPRACDERIVRCDKRSFPPWCPSDIVDSLVS